MTSQRTSIAQVAERAAVSPMTVSRVLRGRKSRFSESTYDRVMAAVRELNYVPTRSAFQNRHVETHTIGYVPFGTGEPDHPSEQFTYNGLCRVARARGYDILTLLRDEDHWMANHEAARFLDRRCDGFVFLSARGGAWHEAIESLIDNEIPVVVCYSREIPEGAAWVDPDNAEIMRLAVLHLSAHGHTRIALLTSSPLEVIAGHAHEQEIAPEGAHYDELARRGHFDRAMSKQQGARHRGVVVEVADRHLTPYRDSLYFLRDAGITAGICGDHLALKLWTLAETNGLSIPADFSLIGIDDQATGSPRGLTSVAFGYSTVGELAGAAWLDLREGKDAMQCHRVAPVRLIERRSAGRPWTSVHRWQTPGL